MNDRPPAIIVSLPARSVAEAVREVELAHDAGADLAEVRFDRWLPPEVLRAEGLFPAKVPLLATYRSAVEGGRGSNDPEERRATLLRLASLPFRWIDLEYDRDLGVINDLPPPEQLGRIVSSHLEGGPTSAWDRRLHELARGEWVGKFVLRSSVRTLFADLLPRLPPPEEGALVVHTIGPSGPLLRALARRLRFPFAFAALPTTAGSDPVEPSQIPVDRLRAYFRAGGTAPLFAVAGRPVAHSRSPELHGKWLDAMRRPGLYVGLEFEDEREFVESLPDLASIGLKGLNVTHPYKPAALAASTEVTPGAARCGAVNCLTLRDGQVEGENTDLLAILRRLDELRADGRWDGRSLTVIGAGGAARATLAAAASLSAQATVIARRPEAVRALAEQFGAQAGTAHTSSPSSLVVHATTVGRAGSTPLEVPVAPLLARGGLLLDWVYRPEAPTLREAARAAGANYEDGWRLFVYQAAASFEVWWDEEPEPRSVEEALREGGCEA
jgi:shikimate dehydrogenase